MRITCLNLSPTYELVYSVSGTGREVTTAESFGIVPGGKGLNVAAMLAKEGTKVDLIMPSLSGFMANSYLEELCASLPSVSIQILETVSIPVRFSTVIVDRSDTFRTNVVRTLVEPDPVLSRAHVNALIEAMEPFLARASPIVMSGSTGVFGPHAYADVTKHASSSGCATYLDAAGAALLHVLNGPWPSVIKINKVEAHKQPPFQQRSEGGQASIVLITDGPNAIHCVNYVSGERFRLQPPRIVTPVSPTGAGDAFMAGLVWAREITMKNGSLTSQINEASEWGIRALNSLNSGIGVGR